MELRENPSSLFVSSIVTSDPDFISFALIVHVD